MTSPSDKPSWTDFDLNAYFEKCQVLIQNELEISLPGASHFPKTIHESMRYSLFAGGKKIRPILCLAGAEACGGGHSDVLPVACALEMIHTFSLIHDDLPAMDDDNLRRGRPTNHKVYGDAVAILAGDGLVLQAFLVLGKLAKTSSDPKRVLEIVHDIAEASGSVGMIGGQTVDLESEGKKISLEELQTLHRLKTGCLLSVSVAAGAKLVCDDRKKLEALERYGKAMGLAFQVADDILDIEGGAEIGKDVGSDIENGKATYPALMGMEKAKTTALKLKNDAIHALAGFGPEADALRAIAAFVVDRKK